MAQVHIQDNFMAHFAQLDSTNNIIRVEVVNNNVITDADGNEQEQVGIDFLTNLYGGVGWYKQTSYNGNFRKNYADVGGVYDSVRDAFIPPKPYPSWTLVEDTCQWTAPVAYPDDGNDYEWDEDTTNWTEIT
tara:strand:+ start:1561 stop:1956 length:396 start_codon:yes stop_codon:yes gene_type:complete